MRYAALFLTFVPTLALAQAPAPAASPAAPAAAAAPAAPAPTVPPEVAKLEFLVGEWVHEEVHQGTPSGVGAKGAARSKNAWIHDGHHLYHLYKSRRPDGSEYDGRGVIAWDAAGKRYRFHWFDSTGAVAVYNGAFDPEGTLIFSAETAGFAGGRELRIRRVDGKILFLAPSFESMAQAAPKGEGAATRRAPEATGTPGAAAATAPAASPTAVPTAK
jgi:hypothetical protein